MPGEPHVALPFSSLAAVYDTIMADIEYDEWVDFALRAARERGFGGGAVLDLGCGTGNATAHLKASGLEVEGLDGSAEMLRVAERKLPGVRFHQARFEEFDLGRRFELVTSFFDSVNNLLTPEAFLATAARVRRHLVAGGLFVFDVNTPAGLKGLWDGGSGANVAEGYAEGIEQPGGREDAEGPIGDVFYRWQNDYDESTGIAEVVAYCETLDGSFVETHHERGYGEAELRELLAQAGFAAVDVMDHPDGGEAPPDAGRLWVVAQVAA